MLRLERTTLPSVHPLCGLWGATIFLASLLMVASPIRIVVLFLLMVTMSVLLRADVIRIARPVLHAWPLVLIAFLMHAIVSSRTAVSYGYSGPFLAVLPHTAAMAGLLAARLALVLLTMSFLFWLHPAPRYGQAVGQLLSRLPFGRAHLAQAELTGTLALRFVPVMALEAKRLRMAWSARGMDSPRSFRTRFRAARALLFPLMVSALRRSDRAADVLTVRGFNPAIVRTRFHHERASAVQLGATVLFTLACLVVPWI
jgi:energy-coupling factor transporter transmembrane protein EcfT